MLTRKIVMILLKAVSNECYFFKGLKLLLLVVFFKKSKQIYISDNSLSE